LMMSIGNCVETAVINQGKRGVNRS
jgi:hypothetical protein